MKHWPTVAVVLLALQACGPAIPQLSPKECADKFSGEVLKWFAPDQMLRLAYELQTENVPGDILGKGIEGVGPTIALSSGASAIAESNRQADALLDAGASARVSIFLADDSDVGRIVYIPGKSFSATQAREHLARMCGYAARGVYVRRFAGSVERGGRVERRRAS